MKRPILTIVLIFLIIVPVTIWIYQRIRPLEEGLSYESTYREGTFTFLYDLTYRDMEGEKKVEQEIFPTIFDEIERAEEFILIDMFLYNDDYDRREGITFPTLSQDLTDALVKRKEDKPELTITVITDPINSFYNSFEPAQWRELRAAGIHVVPTNLRKVKDSNPLYSNFYRAYLRHIQTNKQNLPNLFDPNKPKGTLTAYLDLLNFKANHRKVFLTENSAIVQSANPHDGSSLHSNVALKVTGPILEDILASENAVLKMSNSSPLSVKPKVGPIGESKMKLVTEGKIEKALIKTLESTAAGDQISIGVFYLGDREIVNALKDSAQKGVEIRLILDLNKDAFGKKKIGIPNKQVAAELAKEENITIRWYETQGEQYHSKFMLYQGKNLGKIIAGSANFTRRNLDDLNLETNLVIEAPITHPEMERAYDYYERIWKNEGGTYTSPYEAHAEQNVGKDILYWIQETTGLSTF